MKQKVFLFDGSAFCYRAFYAISHLSNSKGEPTNAVYGFYTMLRKIMDTEKPDYCAICFDRKEETHRKAKFAEYKAHRKPMPDDLVVQIPRIKELCKALNLPIFEKPGYEADDLLGTLAKKIASEERDVFIVTGDKDLFQLVNEKIKIYSFFKDKATIYDIEAVKKKYDGIAPLQITEMLGLMGDASDNIPGVPGIGEKTAISLINEFGSIENLYANIELLKHSSRKTKLVENREMAFLSKDLATVDCEVPIEIKKEDLLYRSGNIEQLKSLFYELEFKRLLSDLEVVKQVKKEENRKYYLVTEEKIFFELIEKLNKQKKISFDTETNNKNPLLADLVGLSFSFKEKEAYYISVKHSCIKTTEGINLDIAIKHLKPILENEQILKIGQNIKYDMLVLEKYGVKVQGVFFDTMVAAYLINPLKLNQNLDDIALSYLNLQKITYSSLVGTGKKQKTLDEINISEVSEYACEDADTVFRLEPLLKKELEKNNLISLFLSIEMPLVSVLEKMEANGVYIDKKMLKKLSIAAEEKQNVLTESIYEKAGEEFNINSTKQLGRILFDKLQLPVVRKTKTGYSTDVSVLEKLAEQHDFPKDILEYREVAKLRSTYLDALPELINPKTGMVHSSFNQTVTATGRLSSSSPNMQNIPIKTEMGRQVRKAFVPRAENRLLMAADYSQIELRLLAHFSADEKLCEAFLDDKDIHQFTATLLYDVPAENITYEMRRVAKVINFSIIYGKTAYGLSQELGLSVQEAKSFIDEYFSRYKKIKPCLEALVEGAKEKGYVTTLFGRRAYVPEINSRNKMRQQFAERAAMNAPFQGSAADLIKKAMIDIQYELDKKKIDALMILQVHDELVFDVAKKDEKSLQTLITQKMENAFSLKVPLKIDVVSGDSWFK